MKNKITLVICIVFLIFTACNNNSNKLSTDLVSNPNSASGTGNIGDLPKFKFETDLHDFGKAIEGEKLSYSFKFKNIGKTDLVIASATASCGCTVPEFPKEPIHPSKDGVITVTFNTAGKTGFQHKTITIVANTQPSNYVLNIKAMVTSPENNK